MNKERRTSQVLESPSRRAKGYTSRYGGLYRRREGRTLYIHSFSCLWLTAREAWRVPNLNWADVTLKSAFCVYIGAIFRHNFKQGQEGAGRKTGSTSTELRLSATMVVGGRTQRRLKRPQREYPGASILNKRALVRSWPFIRKKY